MAVRWFEWGGLFVLIPVLLYLRPGHRFAFLVLVTIYALIIIAVEKPRFRSVQESMPNHLLLRMPLVVALIFLFSWLVFPEQFLSLPEMHPKLWLMVMLLYPLLSVLPQEFLYRRFYFWRYGELFPTPALLLGSNVSLFGFLHIIYGNFIAVFLSLFGGMLFVHTYRSTGRLLPVWIEHSVYGLAVFTSGMGHFFYRPFT